MLGNIKAKFEVLRVINYCLGYLKRGYFQNNINNSIIHTYTCIHIYIYIYITCESSTLPQTLNLSLRGIQIEYYKKSNSLRKTKSQ